MEESRFHQKSAHVHGNETVLFSKCDLGGFFVFHKNFCGSETTSDTYFLPWGTLKINQTLFFSNVAFVFSVSHVIK